MNRHKRIIDCTASEILSIGKDLIDYYFRRKDQDNIEQIKLAMQGHKEFTLTFDDFKETEEKGEE